MSGANRSLLIPAAPQLLRQTMMWMILTTMAITGSILTAPVKVFALQINPSALSFTGTQGAVDPPAQSVTIWKRNDRDKSWTANVSASWLAVSPAAGTISTERDQISVDVNVANLTAGNYSSSITIVEVGPKGGIRRTVLPVSLNVLPAPSIPNFSLSPSSLTFSGTAGGTNPAAKTFTVSNTGTGTLSWTASDNTPWLAVSPASGTNTGTVNASVNLTGLAAGTYNSAITVTAPGATAKTVPVALTVTAPAIPAIGLSPTSLTFTAAVGGTTSAPKPVTISNSGGGTLSWTVSENTAWLTLSPVSGTNSGTVNASVNLTGLAAGSHNAIITVAASGTSVSPRQIPVTLNITTASTATLTWNAGTESDLAGYKVYRGTASGTYGAPLATLPKTITSHTATGLQNGTTYFFVITAYDTAGNESAYSNEVSKSIF